MALNVQASRTELESTVLDTEPGTEPELPDIGTLGAGDDKCGVKLPRVEPVTAAERFFAVDVLRGFGFSASWQ